MVWQVVVMNGVERLSTMLVTQALPCPCLIALSDSDPPMVARVYSVRGAIVGALSSRLVCSQPWR